jgi:class 3 adenylate cyclase
VPARPNRYRWEWSLNSSPDALWPLVSDTNRFNFETGAQRVAVLGTDGAGRRRLRLRALGQGIEFEEEPFEWVRPERFGVVRRFRGGPIAELRARLSLTPRDGGSLLVYEVAATPRGILGRVGVPIAIGRVARSRMDTAFRRYDEELSAGRALVRSKGGPARLAPGGKERLGSLRDGLVAQGADAGLVGRLAELLEGGDELALSRLRPYALADAWGESRREVLELFLAATRAGMLESRWELLCPLCRGAAQSARTLAELELHAHCESCDVGVDADLERSLELVFRPSPAVREVAAADFCVGGPGVTPHVVAQQLLAPAEVRPLRLALEPGSYRVRTRGSPGSEPLVVDPPGGETEVELANPSTTERLLMVERTAWSDQAATAAEVTALQAFRDLFASEALRPGEELAVGRLTVAFTDLRDSTRLYREIGDAPAYGSVVSHFDVLKDAIACEEGAIVKTIGDAVMAVFRRPIASLRALLAAQERLAVTSGGRPLFLKIGIHSGPCLAVTLNDRLDYFGSTVNVAARIVGISSGEDAVISEAVRSDPEVEAFLGSGELSIERVEVTLKGFDDERFALWRVRGADA